MSKKRWPGTGSSPKTAGSQSVNVRQKGDYETDEEGLQNRGQVSDAIWVRIVGYNEATGKTETVKRDEDAT